MSEELQERVRALEAENERLSEALMADVDKLAEMVWREGELSMRWERNFAVRLLAENLWRDFVEGGATNCMEIELCPVGEPGGLPPGRLIATLQRVCGKTPLELRTEALAQLQRAEARADGIVIDVGRTLADLKAELERRYLSALLAANQGRVGRSAVAAGFNRRTLLRKLRRHGLHRSQAEP